MSLPWLLWPTGLLALVAAGFGTALLPRWLAPRRGRLIAWSDARAAIDQAAVSRDAAAWRVAEAEDLLTRAELIAGDHGGRAAARQATDLARRADALWRAATDD